MEISELLSLGIIHIAPNNTMIISVLNDLKKKIIQFSRNHSLQNRSSPEVNQPMDLNR